MKKEKYNQKKAGYFMKTYVWGLTGGIASGKSLATKYFKKLGFNIIDADRIAKALRQKNGRACADIIKFFGTNKTQELREIIFKDKTAKKKLENIMHPLIKEESLKKVWQFYSSAKNKKTPTIYEAALLVETKRYKDLRGLILIDAPAPTRKQRLIKRDKITPNLADKIILKQISDKKRKSNARYIIPNASSRTGLQKEIKKLAGILLCLPY